MAARVADLEMGLKRWRFAAAALFAIVAVTVLLVTGAGVWRQRELVSNAVVLRWFVGLVGISGFLGAIVTPAFISVVERRLPAVDPDPFAGQPGWLPALIGVVERLFFTVLIAFDSSVSGPAMIGWAALKGAAHWNSFNAEAKPHTFLGFMGTMVSLLFAVLGGLWCRGK